MFIIYHRRRREQKTDFKKRLAMVKSEKTRLVIRKSLSGVKIQFIDYDANGDKTIVSAVPNEIKKLGWTHSQKNIPACYLVGLLAGKKAAAKKISEAILDAGLQTSTKGSKIYAALKGVVDAGINVPHSQDILPSQDRLLGKHVQNAKDIAKNIEEVKKKIMSG